MSKQKNTALQTSVGNVPEAVSKALGKALGKGVADAFEAAVKAQEQNKS